MRRFILMTMMFLVVGCGRTEVPSETFNLGVTNGHPITWSLEGCSLGQDVAALPDAVIFYRPTPSGRCLAVSSEVHVTPETIFHYVMGGSQPIRGSAPAMVGVRWASAPEQIWSVPDARDPAAFPIYPLPVSGTVRLMFGITPEAAAITVFGPPDLNQP